MPNENQLFARSKVLFESDNDTDNETDVHQDNIVLDNALSSNDMNRFVPFQFPISDKQFKETRRQSPRFLPPPINLPIPDQTVFRHQ